MINFPNYIFIDDSTLERVSLNNVIRAETEIGPHKTRPIQSIPLFQCSMSVSMCDFKLLDWRMWWASIKFGSNWFLMDDPFDGVKRRFRFVETEINWKKTGNLYQTQFVLEAYDELL